MNDLEGRLTRELRHRAEAVEVRFDVGQVIDDASEPSVVVGRMRSGRSDRWPVRGSVAAVAAVLVAVVAAVAVVTVGEDDRDRTQPLVASTPEVSGVDDSVELVEGFGEWSALPSAPSGLASGITDGRELSDGRILFWGTHAAASIGDAPEAVDGLVETVDPRPTPLAMAVYSPAEGGWTSVDTSSLADAQLLGFRWASERLLAWGARMDGSNVVAVYDPTADRWTESTVPGTRWESFDGVAWTGEVAVLVRLHPGIGDDEASSETGIDPTGFRPSGGVPRVWRWRLADDGWTEGAAPPIAARAYGGWAFDGNRLATVGGVDGEDMRSRVGERSTGAVYEVDSDTWTVLPGAPWSAKDPELAWDGEDLVYLGGTGGVDVNRSGGFIDRFARWNESTGWAAFAPPDHDGLDPTVPDTVRIADHGLAKGTSSPGRGVDGGDPRGAVLAASDGFAFGLAEVGWLYVDGEWETVPIGDPMTVWWGDRLVATSPSVIGAVERFQVAARIGQHRWVGAAPSPVSDLWSPAVVVAGDRLYVVGTPREAVWQEGRDPVSEAWVLDLAS